MMQSRWPEYDQLPGESVPEWNARRACIAAQQDRACACGIVRDFGEGARFSHSHVLGCPAHHDRKEHAPS
jgi:hypothetical protein